MRGQISGRDKGSAMPGSSSGVRAQQTTHGDRRISCGGYERARKGGRKAAGGDIRSSTTLPLTTIEPIAL